MAGYGSASVLLSGGIDSAVAAAMVRPAFAQVHSVAVDYQQSHRIEIDAAAEVRWRTLLGEKWREK